MFDQIKKFAEDNKETITNVVIGGLVVAGCAVIYNWIFDYGYECRVNLEKEAGNGLFEKIQAFGDEEF